MTNARAPSLRPQIGPPYKQTKQIVETVSLAHPYSDLVRYNPATKWIMVAELPALSPLQVDEFYENPKCHRIVLVVDGKLRDLDLT